MYWDSLPFHHLVPHTRPCIAVVASTAVRSTRGKPSDSLAAWPAALPVCHCQCWLGGRCQRMLRVLSGVGRPRATGSCSLSRRTGSFYAAVRGRIFRQSNAAMSSPAAASRVVAVVSPLSNPALAAMPTVAGVEFIIGDDLATFQASPRLADCCAIMFLPPASPAVLPELWPHVPNVKWFHSFFAGVDSLRGFFPTLAEARVPLSNGRGAFSVKFEQFIPCANQRSSSWCFTKGRICGCWFTTPRSLFRHRQQD